MKGLKPTLVSTLAIGMLAAATVGATAQDADGSRPATVLGTLDGFEESNEAEGRIADAVLRSQNDVSAQLMMNDARLTGVWIGTQGINRYAPNPDGRGAAEVYSGNVTIENDSGTWVGTIHGCSGCGVADAEGFMTDVFHLELAGTAAYDGLSALLYADQTGFLRGVIIPGELSPEGPGGLAVE